MCEKRTGPHRISSSINHHRTPNKKQFAHVGGLLHDARTKSRVWRSARVSRKLNGDALGACSRWRVPQRRP